MHLQDLSVCDPFNIPNSDELVSFLKLSNPGACQFFSIDVEDLYYSMPFDDLLKSVRLCITNENDGIKFRNSCGLSVSTFLEILSVYLQSTFVEWKGKFYRQKTGVCIGSKVAPVLSSIYLGGIDKKINENLGAAATKIVRYVDDFLVFVNPGCLEQKVSDVLKLFKEYGRGLSFTVELPKDKQLQFLDLRLTAGGNHVCWSYFPRSKKPILNFNSGHSKIVKMGIAASCLRAALTKTCPDKITTSFGHQLHRLKEAGFPHTQSDPEAIKMREIRLGGTRKSKWKAAHVETRSDPVHS